MGTPPNRRIFFIIWRLDILCIVQHNAARIIHLCKEQCANRHGPQLRRHSQESHHNTERSGDSAEAGEKHPHLHNSITYFLSLRSTTSDLILHFNKKECNHHERGRPKFSPPSSQRTTRQHLGLGRWVRARPSTSSRVLVDRRSGETCSKFCRRYMLGWIDLN